MFTSVLKDMIKDTDEQPDEEMCRPRSGRVLSTGTSVRMELACLTLPVSGCVQPTWKAPKPHTIGISWTFHHVVCVCVCVCALSHVQLFATPWTIALQAPLSMQFCRQEYWSGLPLPSPGDLPDPEMKAVSPVSPALAGGFISVNNYYLHF